MKNKYLSCIEEYIDIEPAEKMILNAFKELKLKNDSEDSKYYEMDKVFTMLIILIALLISIFVGFSNNTISIFISILELLVSILLGIFGIIFTAYSILLAFLNENYIKKLSQIKQDNDNVSYLKKSTTYYESVLFLYFTGMFISIIVLILVKVMDVNFTLTENLLFNNLLASILLFIYMFYTLRIIYELKSTIYNTITLFRVSISYKLIDFAKEEKKQEEVIKNEEESKSTNEGF
jgi:hypothetical protein